MPRNGIAAFLILLFFLTGCEFFGTDETPVGAGNMLRVELTGVRDELYGQRVLFSALNSGDSPDSGIPLAGGEFYLYDGQGSAVACRWDSAARWYVPDDWYGFSNTAPVDLYLMVDANGNFSSTGAPDNGDYTWEKKGVTVNGLTTLVVNGADLTLKNDSGGNTLYVVLKDFPADWIGRNAYFGVLSGTAGYSAANQLAAGSFVLQGTESGGYAKVIDAAGGGISAANYFFSAGEQVSVYFMVDVNNTKLEFIPAVTPGPGYGDFSAANATMTVMSPLVHTFAYNELSMENRCQLRVKLSGFNEPDGTVVKVYAGEGGTDPLSAGYVPYGSVSLTLKGGIADGFLTDSAGHANLADNNRSVALHVAVKSNGNTGTGGILEKGDKYAGFDTASPFTGVFDGDLLFEIQGSQITQLK